MGGRGTFAKGRTGRLNYKTVGYIEGVPVVKGLHGEHSLPVETLHSRAYIRLDHKGEFRKMRIYDKEHYIKYEIAYHREPKLDPSRKPVLHIHEYKKKGSFEVRPARLLTKRELRKYKKYLIGVEIND